MTARSFTGFPATLDASWALSRSASPIPPIPSPPNSRNDRRRIGPQQVRVAAPDPISFERLLAIDASPSESPETQWKEVSFRLTLSPTDRDLQCFPSPTAGQATNRLPSRQPASKENPSPPCCNPLVRHSGSRNSKKTGRVAGTTPARSAFLSIEQPDLAAPGGPSAPQLLEPSIERYRVQ